jgi:hypothetical protein
VQLPHSARVSQTIVLTSTGAAPLNANVLEATVSGLVTATDAFGYQLRPDVTYDFIDISATGQAVNPSDDGEFNVTLTFPITFYGVGSTQLRVGNNGALLFNDNQGDIVAYNVPMLQAPEFFIAPFWDDLDSHSGLIYWQELGVAPNRMVVVQWQDRPHYGGFDETVTFEVVLHENGNIVFQYQDVTFGMDTNDRGASATVGIRGQGIFNRLEYSYNTPSLRDGFAICFQHPSAMACDASSDEVPWLTTTPSQVVGLIGSPHSSRNMIVTFDSAQVPGVGVYSAWLLLRSDAPMPELVIPVTMVVTGGRYLPLVMVK